MLSINDFKTRSNIPASLIDAVSGQLPYDPETDLEELAGTLHDVANYGASGGYGSFVYYADTCKFTSDNLRDIMQYVEGEAKDFGTDALTMIAGFKCLKDLQLSAHDVAKALYQSPRNDEQEGNQTSVLNALAWYALEEVARQYVDMQENDD